MSDPPATKRPLAHVLDEALLHDELEELAAMDPATLDKELAEAGYDAKRTAVRIAAARKAAYEEPIGEVAPPAAPPAKVVDIGAARAKRVATTRWVPLVAAAALALLVGVGGAQYAATWKPATTVTYATVGKPPSPWELALPLRHRALRLCAQGYYGECQDALDEAQKVDPQGDTNETVQAARAEIAAAHATDVYVKPHVAPNERPLQRHP